MVAALAVIVVPAVRLQAQADVDSQPNRYLSTEVVISGFRASSSSPFIVQGNVIGQGAIWKRVAGPSLSPTFAVIPATSGATPAFTGAACRAEYTQDQIITPDGSTMTVNVFGTRCEPNASRGAHSTVGVYSFVNGTGLFERVTAGTGPVTIDSHADGSASIHIGGFLRVCSAGACGS